MPKKSASLTQTLLKIGTALFLLLMAGMCVWAWRQGLLRDAARLQAFIGGKGVWAPLIFILMQIMQILMAFVPGGILLTAGVVCFGPWLGLLYNFAGTLLGSAINFAIAKRWGRPLVHRLVSEQTRLNYFKWLEENHTRFTWLFAAAILLPFFPDDALCLIAGLTEMSWKRFLLILLLKLPTIAAYSILYLSAVPLMGG
ncbi:MAG: TVP38/TMEM64 family protein [Clostridia bacterium]|nr:TVP38/TMEM64 family protein [Clostridia bacterium]